MKHNFLKLLNKKKKYIFCSLILLIFFGSLFESISIAAVAPIISLIVETKNIIPDNIFFRQLNVFIDLSNFSKIGLIYIFTFFFVIFFIVKNVYLFLVKIISESFLFNLRHELSFSILQNIMYRDYRDLIKKNSSYYITLVLNIVSELINNIYLSFIFLIKEILLLVFIILILIFYDAKTTVTLLSCFVFISCIYYYFSKKKLTKWSQEKILYDDIQIRSLNESFSLFKFLKISKNESILIEKFKLNNKKTNDLSKKIVILNYSPILIFETVIVIFLGSYLIFLSDIKENSLIDKVPLLSIMILAFIRLRPSVGQILQSFNNLRYGREFLSQYMDNISENSKKIKFKNLKLRETIKIKNLSFAYKNKKLFSEFNLNINKGDLIGIEGKTGSGKTTLVELILGLQKRDKGEIFLDNKNIHEKNLFDLIEIGYVPQEIFLLNESLRNNLTFLSDLDQKVLQKSIECSELSDLIKSLSKGLDTEIKENGKNISGGQKQRIGIARALYKQPEVLILDEATNALDQITQEKIYKNVKSMNLTTIIISHQKENLKICDKVIKL